VLESVSKWRLRTLDSHLECKVSLRRSWNPWLLQKAEVSLRYAKRFFKPALSYTKRKALNALAAFWALMVRSRVTV